VDLDFQAFQAALRATLSQPEKQKKAEQPDAKKAK
jgi:hypothetical protein